MFLLGIGEILEEWTHKKSVDDLARTMSLNVGKVWMVREEQEVLIPASEIKAGDLVRIRMGKRGAVRRCCDRRGCHAESGVAHRRICSGQKDR